MLMNVVLPAPFVPIRPTTESLSIAALTSFAAVTAPKVLHSPRASRMAGIAPSEHGPEPLGQEHDDEKEREPQAHLPGVGREIVSRGMDHTIDQCAGEGRNHASGAGEDRDEDELPRCRPERH